MAREATNQLLEMIEDGALDRDTVIMACIKYMSEDDVRDMCNVSEFFERCAECGTSAPSLDDGLCEDCAEARDSADDDDESTPTTEDQ